MEFLEGDFGVEEVGVGDLEGWVDGNSGIGDFLEIHCFGKFENFMKHLL